MCTPSRYALLTGRYCWRTQLKVDCLFGHDPLLIEEDRMTLPSMLKPAGYTTACVGKWHLGFGKDYPDWNGELSQATTLSLHAFPIYAGNCPPVILAYRLAIALLSGETVVIRASPTGRDDQAYSTRS